MRRVLGFPALYAFVCAALVLGWQALTVQFNYSGDWTALFHTGAYARVPPNLEEEGTYRIAGDRGYDGQYYHFVAHDPMLLGRTGVYVDNPRLRYRRILLPACAWLLALGKSDYIDSTYAISVLVFVFLGSWWLGVFCRERGLPAASGLAFAAVPAVLVSIDRFTVDVALAALTVAFAVYAGRRAGAALYVVLALAPLARETGVVLPAGYALVCLLRRDIKHAAAAAATLLPAAFWAGYIHSRTPPDYTVFASPVPLAGLVERTMHPVQYALASRWLIEAAVLDYLAVLGVWAGLGVLLLLAREGDWKPELAAAAVFTGVFVAFLRQPQAWEDAYAFARTMSPLLILTALAGMARRRWYALLPLAMTAPRIIFQLGPQWRGILRGVLQSL